MMSIAASLATTTARSFFRLAASRIRSFGRMMAARTSRPRDADAAPDVQRAPGDPPVNTEATEGLEHAGEADAATRAEASKSSPLTVWVEDVGERRFRSTMKADAAVLDEEPELRDREFQARGRLRL